MSKGLKGFIPLEKGYKQQGDMYIRFVSGDGGVYLSKKLRNYLKTDYVIILLNETDKKVALIPCKATDKNSFEIVKSGKICNKNFANLFDKGKRYIGQALEEMRGVLFDLWAA